MRESYRERGKVKSRTLANISDWPEAKIDSLRRVLAGETLVPLAAERFEIARALAHGHVGAVLGTLRRLGLDKMLPKGPERRAKLILAMIVARIIEPAAKLATARGLSEATAAHSLGAVLGPRALRPGGRRGRTLRRPRPFGPQPGERREGPRSAPPRGRRARALRRHLELSRGAALRAGAIRI